jgi:hypothetical protein
MELTCVWTGRHAGLRTVGQGRASAKPLHRFFLGFFAFEMDLVANLSELSLEADAVSRDCSPKTPLIAMRNVQTMRRKIVQAKPVAVTIRIPPLQRWIEDMRQAGCLSVPSAALFFSENPAWVLRC